MDTAKKSEQLPRAQLEELQECICKHGVSNLQEVFKAKLEEWREVEVNIAITGESGTGKSSYINALRGLNDDDEQAAKVGVKETTLEPTCYDHPSNPKIKLTDLPGVGTPTFPDLQSYCQSVNLDKYDTFLILTSIRFTKNDLILAKKISSLGKKFFFVRTKIDENIRAESRKRSFDENVVLEEIRNDCIDNLSTLLEKREDVFLISNHDLTRWDFDRLTSTILDVLPIRQKEALSLSLKAVSKDLLKRKVEILRGRISKVACISALSASIPVPGLSIAVDMGLIAHEISFFKSQLGIPMEGWKVFLMLHANTQDKIRRICLSAASLVSLLSVYVADTVLEEVTRMFIPIIGSGIAAAMSFSSTYHLLAKQLREIEMLAIKVLEEVAQSSLEDSSD